MLPEILKYRSEDYGLRCEDEIFREDFREDYEKRAKITKTANNDHSLGFLVLFCRVLQVTLV